MSFKTVERTADFVTDGLKWAKRKVCRMVGKARGTDGLIAISRGISQPAAASPSPVVSPHHALWAWRAQHQMDIGVQPEPFRCAIVASAGNETPLAVVGVR